MINSHNSIIRGKSPCVKYIISELFTETNQRRLACDIGRHIRKGLAACAADDVDDSPRPACNHVRQDFPAAKHRATKVDLLAPPPIVGIVLPERAQRTTDAGV